MTPMTRISPFSNIEDYKEEVIKLILAIQQTEFGIPITLKDQPDLENISSYYQRGKGNFWIAVAEDKLVGCVALLDIGNSRGALRKMFVHKQYRGKRYGVGQMLLNQLIKWAGENEVKEILLGTTDQFTAAQRFYEKNGFSEIDKNQLPEEFPVMKVDVKFYHYILPH